MILDKWTVNNMSILEIVLMILIGLGTVLYITISIIKMKKGKKKKDEKQNDDKEERE